nr:Hpt domain-containing protein [uncultured Sellimonas sp.]
MDIKELSEKTGCNLEAALTRFGGMEALYVRLLKKFLEDQSFMQLKEAVEQQDMQTVEHAAHTLKGVAGNLGLDVLQDSSAEIVQAVREGHSEQIEELFFKCSKDYDRIMEAIREVL